jgi:MFS family permease
MNGLADVVLVVHAAIVLFIVGGLVAIWIGALFGWRWVRSRAFRAAHLAAIGVVALLALLGVACPLTVLEDWLRHDAGATQGFVQRWVGRVLYYEWPAWVFTLAYVVFAALVGLTWRLVRPGLHERRERCERCDRPR